MKKHSMRNLCLIGVALYAYEGTKLTVIHPSKGRNNLSPTGTFKARYYSKAKRMALENMVKEFLN